MPNVTCMTLGVRSLAKSQVFYEVLGFKAGFVSDEVVFFQLRGSVLALYRQDRQAADLGLVRRPVPGGISLAINLPSKKAVDTFFAKVRQAKAQVLRAPHTAVWGGYTCYFSDPDGHPWEVAWNPHWKLDKQGRVKL